MGMQVARGHPPPVQEAGVLREVEAAERRDLAGAVPPARGGAGSRAVSAGSCPPGSEYCSAVPRGGHAGLAERQEGGADSAGAVAGAAEDRGAVLGGGLVGEHGGSGRGPSPARPP